MSWTQQGDHWSRPLDCHDKLWQFVSKLGKPVDREHWLLVGAVELEFPPDLDPIASLHAAWKALRLRHPDVALEMTVDDKRYYPLPSPNDLDDWCDLTFRVDHNVQSSDELLTEHLHQAEPSATCHWIPASKQLCLVSAHWRWDGRGLYMVLHDLLSELESPTPLPETLDGSEAHNLIPTLDVVIDMPSTYEPAWVQKADDLFNTFITGQPSIGLPIAPGKATTNPRNSHRAQLSLSTQQAASLRQACRDKGLSLSAAIHASAVAATVALNPTSPAEKYTSWAIFDIRKYCPAPYNGAIHGPSLRMIGLPVSVEARSPWLDLVNHMQPIYKQDWSPDDSDMIYTRVPFVEKAVAAMNAQAEAASATQAPMPPSEPYIINLGIVDEYIKQQYGGVRVRDVKLGVQELSQQLLVHCWSWMGGLVVSASYNEAYYERVDVEGFLEELKESLGENLLA
ncbi:uncharacterized protein BDV14DRAFT_191539 [Aspergillus stella-maris]|uniref:uncharacterized protein n=1 Tax=Aspergillus stella-maris TaxID=1810926 RepID=UPI003CCD8C63